MDINKIVADIKSGELTRDNDEAGAKGFWDLAQETSVSMQLDQDPNTTETIWSIDSQTERLYGLFWSIAEAAL